jgi:hypothetical protein
MQTNPRRSINVVRLGLLALLFLVIGAAAGAGVASARAKSASAGTAAGQSQAADPQHAQRIVDQYLGILNSGMTGGCDFSALSSVYAPDATLTLTGGPFAPGGPPIFGSHGSLDELRYQGLTAITGFYTTFCHFLSGGPGVGQWTQDAGFLLSPNVLNSYEHVTLAKSPKVGRCMHVFTISGDRIASLDWAVYE